uniref:Uncharacterized protein n=1 Tax=Arundo donax TaxID=35708 RepID=A0A0A9DGB3_ARUDO
MFQMHLRKRFRRMECDPSAPTYLYLLFGCLTEEPPVTWVGADFVRPGGFRADSLGFGFVFDGGPFFVRNNLAILDGASCICSAAASDAEAAPTEYSVPATKQPSSDTLSSHSASPDLTAPDNRRICWLLSFLSANELGDMDFSLTS